MKRDRSGIKLAIILTVAAIMIALSITSDASAVEFWRQKWVRFAATAGETLAIGDVVCIKNADGKAYKADANSATLRPAVGVIGKGGSSNATVEIVVTGILAGQSALSTGYRLFLSETAGAMTITGPTNAQIVGWVMSTSGSTTTSTTYFINVMPETSGGAGF